MKNKLLFIVCIAVLGVLLGLRSYWIGIGETRTQAKWDAAIVATATAAVEHQQQQIKKRIETESHISQENQRINQNDYSRTQTMEARIAELNAANERLQLTIEQQRSKLNRMPTACTTTSTSTTPYGTAASSGDILAECPAQYTALAADAERLSRQVAGLQDYARMCQEYGK